MSHWKHNTHIPPTLSLLAVSVHPFHEEGLALCFTLVAWRRVSWWTCHIIVRAYDASGAMFSSGLHSSLNSFWIAGALLGGSHAHLSPQQLSCHHLFSKWFIFVVFSKLPTSFSHKSQLPFHGRRLSSHVIFSSKSGGYANRFNEYKPGWEHIQLCVQACLCASCSVVPLLRELLNGTRGPWCHCWTD